MSRFITCLLLGATAAVLSVTSALAYDWTISNSSKWAIHEVYISSCGNRYWGQDRLGSSAVMHSGDSYVLHDIDGGCYDVKLVDEDGDVCVINKVRINDDEDWNVTDRALLNCEGSN
jgi:hypothetical protein